MGSNQLLWCWPVAFHGVSFERDLTLSLVQGWHKLCSFHLPPPGAMLAMQFLGRGLVPTDLGDGQRTYSRDITNYEETNGFVWKQGTPQIWWYITPHFFYIEIIYHFRGTPHSQTHANHAKLHVWSWCEDEHSRICHFMSMTLLYRFHQLSSVPSTWFSSLCMFVQLVPRPGLLLSTHVAAAAAKGMKFMAPSGSTQGGVTPHGGDT